MKKMILGAAAAALVALSGLATAQDPQAEFLASLDYRDGVIAVPEANATLRLTEGFRYLGKADARRVLEDWWNNPADDTVLGMLVPTADGLDTDHAWVVVLTWSGEGYVPDEDAADYDYDDLLALMQDETRDNNAYLAEAGYPTVELVGWAQAPRYDAVNKRLHWAKHLQFEGSEGGTLNYDIRVLGRRGFLSMNAVAAIDDLERVNAGMAEVLGMASFDAGHRYADYVEGDHTAAYGLAALIGGGLAAKTGLLAKIGLFLAKFWKLLLFGGIGLAAVIGKLRGAKKAEGTVS